MLLILCILSAHLSAIHYAVGIVPLSPTEPLQLILAT